MPRIGVRNPAVLSLQPLGDGGFSSRDSSGTLETMSSHSSRIISPADGGGPSGSPPSVPEGWLAQWDDSRKRWFYAQRATGRSQWEVPTEPYVSSPSATPQSAASPGPYNPPGSGAIPPSSDAEATQELMEVRTGANWRGSGGNYSGSTPATHMHQNNQSPGLRTTPVGGAGSNQASPSSQGMFSQVASDLATRSASSDRSTRRTTPQSVHDLPSPGGQTPTSRGDYTTMNPQYPQDPQQPTAQMQGYHYQSDPMQLDNPRMVPQGQHPGYRGADNTPVSHHTGRTSSEGTPGSYPHHQNPPGDPMGGVAPTNTGPGYQYGDSQSGMYGNSQQHQQQAGSFRNDPSIAAGRGQQSLSPHEPPQDPAFFRLTPDPDNPLFPPRFPESSQRRGGGHRSGASQPQYDQRYPQTSERPPPPGYGGRSGQPIDERNHMYQHQPQQPPTQGGGYPPNQGRYNPHQTPRYEQPQHDDRQGMQRQPSQYDQSHGMPAGGFPPAASGYEAARGNRYSGGGRGR